MLSNKKCVPNTIHLQDGQVSIAVTLRLARSELPTVVRKLRGGGGGGRNFINLKRKKKEEGRIGGNDLRK